MTSRTSTILLAIVLCLPAWLIIIVVSAPVIPLLQKLETSHISTAAKPILLHNALHRSLHSILSMFQSNATIDDSPTPHLRISLTRDNRQKLDTESYQEGLIQYGEDVFSAGIRYKKGHNWHRNGLLKSYRFKLEQGILFGRDRLNIVAPKAPVPWFESLAMSWVKRAGLLALDSHPVRIFEENTYAGLGFYLEKPDEIFLKKYGKPPGHVYAIDLEVPSQNQVSLAWSNADLWLYEHRDPNGSPDRKELKKLVSALNSSPTEFYRTASDLLNLDQFAKYLSFDSIIGCFHHTPVHNHRFYFDPLAEKFTPIQWDILYPYNMNFSGINESDNPLLQAWELIPFFQHLRLVEMWKAINGPLNIESLQRNIAEYHQSYRQDIEKQRMRQSLAYIPLINLGWVDLTKAWYSMDELDKNVEYLQETLAERQKNIKKWLSHVDIGATQSDTDGVRELLISIGGNAPVKLQKIVFSAPVHKASIYRDINSNRVLDKKDWQIDLETEKNRVLLNETLYPGYKVSPRKTEKLAGINPRIPMYGSKKLTPAPIFYRYFLSTDQQPLSLFFVNAVTGEQIEEVKVEVNRRVIEEQSHSAHPWDLTLLDTNRGRKPWGPIL